MRVRAVKPVAQVALTGFRRYHGESKPFKYPTMDECAIPQGSWQEYYDKKQKVFMMQLIGGLAFLTGAFTIAKASGALYLNAGPKLPEGYVDKRYYD